MYFAYSRRTFLGTVAVTIAGCVDGSGGSDGSDNEEPSASSEDDATEEDLDSTADKAMSDSQEEKMNSSDDITPPDQREELVEQLPDRSPLVESLADVVVAPDREATAARFNIEFRAEDHSVRVAIELEADGELPDEYRVDEVSRYDGRVIAYVHVDDLVPLAIDENIRRIRKPEESKTAGT